MSAVCPEASVTLRRLRLREEDLLPAGEHAELLSHVASCRPCRDAALAADPTLLFAPLSSTASGAAPLSPRARQAEDSDVRRLAADVRAVLELQRSRRRLTARRNGILRRAAALAGLAAGLAGLLLTRGGPHGGAPSAVPAAAVVTEAPAVPRPAAAARVTLPLIEGVRGREAQVYQFAADAPGDPTVVFVVDQSVDL